LTPAQNDTFIEAEVGMLPPNLRWRLKKPLFQLFFRRWLRDLLDALPKVVAQSSTQTRARTEATS
jgi:hypothetical protein